MNTHTYTCRCTVYFLSPTSSMRRCWACDPRLPKGKQKPQTAWSLEGSLVMASRAWGDVGSVCRTKLMRHVALCSVRQGPFHRDGCEEHCRAAESGQCKLLQGALRKCRPAPSKASLGSRAATYKAASRARPGGLFLISQPPVDPSTDHQSVHETR